MKTRSFARGALAALLAMSLALGAFPAGHTVALAEGGQNLALLGTTHASASGQEVQGQWGPELAIDGDKGQGQEWRADTANHRSTSASRWSAGNSQNTNDTWIAVDLGATANVDHVTVTWSKQYAVTYAIEASNDGRSWEVVADNVHGAACAEVSTRLEGVSARHLRVHVKQKSAEWATSLWEFEVFGSWAGEAPTPDPDEPAGSEGLPALVPTPVSYEAAAGEAFVLSPSSKIVATSEAARAEAEKLAATLRVSTGYELPVVTESAGDAPDITYAIVEGGAEESYRLAADAQGLSVTAPDAHGLFNASQTIYQLLGPFSVAKFTTNGPWDMPALRISDQPRYSYRGIMLDPARSFFTVDEVKQAIDVMSLYKYSYLHLHLTDDQGWRVEITNEGREAGDAIDYTRLTSESGQGAMAPTERNAKSGVSGYYTQDDLRDITAYAAEHHIRIVPEVDVPGHSAAILHAIPQLNTPGSSHDGTRAADGTAISDPAQYLTASLQTNGNVGETYLDYGNQDTWTFFSHVIDQVAELTDATYVHIGGDEAHKMNQEQPGVHAQFVTKAGDVVRGKGLTPIGWNEWVDASMESGDVIQFWNGGKQAVAAKTTSQGARVIYSWAGRCYFPQKAGESIWGATWANGIVGLDDVYNFDPTADMGVSEGAMAGVEGAMWNEHVRSIQDFFFPTYPRAAALAEVAWSPQARREGRLDDLKGRIAATVPALTLLGADFYAEDGLPNKPLVEATDATVTAGDAVTPVLAHAYMPMTTADDVSAKVVWDDGAEQPLRVSQPRPYQAPNAQNNNDRAQNGIWELSLGSLPVAGEHTGTVHFQAGSLEATDAVRLTVSPGTTSAPPASSVVPNAAQYAYQRQELAAFCHFGPNTMSGEEWGEKYGKNGMKTAVQYMDALSAFDADGYVRMIKDAGFKRLIVTAKHHDGFCLWDSKLTDYDMASTKSKLDVLAEISRACTEQDLDMGLYLSPWDIHEKSYGNGTPGDYNDFYDGQLREILGNEKYGNHGKFVEVWMDGAKGEGQFDQTYDFQRWDATIRELEGPDCLIFQGGAEATVRWLGNENGIAPETNWNMATLDPNSKDLATPFVKEGNHIKGSPDGTTWLVPEADTRITSGWFWGPSKSTPKSMAELASIYFSSVGRGATLLLNVPPNDTGTVDAAIRERVDEFGRNIRESFADDLTQENAELGRAKATVEASSTWQDAQGYGADKVLDGDRDSYWCAGASTPAQTLTITLPSKQTFDAVSLEEAIQNGQRISGFRVFYRADDAGEWVECASGTTIGAKRVLRLSPIQAKQVKVELAVYGSEPAQISSVGLFKLSSGFERTSSIPAGLKVIDNAEMATSGTWNQQPLAECVEGTSMWSNKAGSKASFDFTGTKLMLVGTRDPGHGKARITIDDEDPIDIDTKASARDVSALLWESGTLAPGNHHVTIELLSSALGIDAAGVLDNGGVGMLEFDESAFDMDEDATHMLGITREGGSTGALSVLVSFEPGTAVQGDFYTEPVEVSFADGETHKEVPVRTKRNSDGAGATGDGYFSVSMGSLSPDSAVVGRRHRAVVTIRDRETAFTPERLSAALQAAEALANVGLYTDESVQGLRGAIVDAQALMADGAHPTADQIHDSVAALEAAQKALVERGAYTADAPFDFPSVMGETSTIELEKSQLRNDTTGDNGWPMKVIDNPGASGGKIVDAVGQGDTLSIPFVARRAGSYKATLTYQSGSTANKVAWADAQTGDAAVIRSGEHIAGNGNADEFKTVELTFEIARAGSSTLVFTGPAESSPRMDKIDVTLVRPEQAGVVGQAGTGGSVEPAGFSAFDETGTVTLTVTPDEGNRIRSITMDGEPVEVTGDGRAPVQVRVNARAAAGADAPSHAVARSASDETARDIVVTALFEPADPAEPDPAEPTDPTEPTDPEQPGTGGAGGTTTPTDPEAGPGGGVDGTDPEGRPDAPERPQADVDGLAALVERASELDGRSFEPEGWQRLQDELAGAKALLATDAPTGEAVEAAKASLESAMRALVPSSEKAPAAPGAPAGAGGGTLPRTGETLPSMAAGPAAAAVAAIVAASAIRKRRFT